MIGRLSRLGYFPRFISNVAPSRATPPSGAHLAFRWRTHATYTRTRCSFSDPRRFSTRATNDDADHITAGVGNQDALEKTLLNWYPGHMAKAEREMGNLLKQVDMVIEVRDARAPLTSANPSLSQLAPNHTRLLVFNKADLAPDNTVECLRQNDPLFASSPNVPCMFISAIRRQKMRRLLPYAVNQLKTRRQGASRLSYNIMVVGIPNVGKSTVVNAIRSLALKGEPAKTVAKTGPRPGVTRAISNALLVHKQDPRIYLVDTPGVFVPRVPSVEAGLKLALINSIPETLVNAEDLVDFLLSHARRSGQPLALLDGLGLPQSYRAVAETHWTDGLPTSADHLLEDMMRHIPSLAGRTNVRRSVLRDMAAKLLVARFRDGSLGSYGLDL